MQQEKWEELPEDLRKEVENIFPREVHEMHPVSFYRAYANMQEAVRITADYYAGHTIGEVAEVEDSENESQLAVFWGAFAILVALISFTVMPMVLCWGCGYSYAWFLLWVPVGAFLGACEIAKNN